MKIFRESNRFSPNPHPLCTRVRTRAQGKSFLISYKFKKKKLSLLPAKRFKRNDFPVLYGPTTERTAIFEMKEGKLVQYLSV